MIVLHCITFTSTNAALLHLEIKLSKQSKQNTVESKTPQRGLLASRPYGPLDTSSVQNRTLRVLATHHFAFSNVIFVVHITSHSKEELCPSVPVHSSIILQNLRFYKIIPFLSVFCYIIFGEGVVSLPYFLSTMNTHLRWIHSCRRNCCLLGLMMPRCFLDHRLRRWSQTLPSRLRLLLLSLRSDRRGHSDGAGSLWPQSLVSLPLVCLVALNKER